MNSGKIVTEFSNEFSRESLEKYLQKSLGKWWKDKEFFEIISEGVSD